MGGDCGFVGKSGPAEGINQAERLESEMFTNPSFSQFQSIPDATQLQTNLEKMSVEDGKK